MGNLTPQMISLYIYLIGIPVTAWLCSLYFSDQQKRLDEMKEQSRQQVRLAYAPETTPEESRQAVEQSEKTRENLHIYTRFFDLVNMDRKHLIFACLFLGIIWPSGLIYLAWWFAADVIYLVRKAVRRVLRTR